MTSQEKEKELAKSIMVEFVKAVTGKILDNTRVLRGIEVPSLIYHYTNENAFYGIIKNKEMWASHHKYLNDISELVGGLEALGNIVEIEAIRTENGFIKSTMKFMARIIAEAVPHAEHYFVASFCGNVDSLNQWRTYCPKGGLCFGIPPEAFTSVKQELRGMMPCYYDEKERDNFFKIVAKSIKEEIEDKLLGNIPDPEIGIDMLERGLEVISLTLSGICICLKGQEYEQEQEYRYYERTDSVTPFKRMVEENKVSFRKDKSCITPFMRLPLPTNEDNIVLVKDIIIARHHPTADLLQHSLQMMKGSLIPEDCEIRISETTYSPIE